MQNGLPTNLPAGSLYIPPELVRAYVSAVILIALVALLCAVVYFVAKACVAMVKKALAWRRMSKVERARAYLRKHDPEFRQGEQVRDIVRSSSRPGVRLVSPGQSKPNRKVGQP